VTGSSRRDRGSDDGSVVEPPEPKLFAVYLGGDPAPGRLSEDHEVVHVVASDIREARAAARAKWGGTTRPHVDAVKRLGVVDGYRVGLLHTRELESSEIDATYEPEEP
jgi:hypothetical protein